MIGVDVGQRVDVARTFDVADQGLAVVIDVSEFRGARVRRFEN